MSVRLDSSVRAASKRSRDEECYKIDIDINTIVTFTLSCDAVIEGISWRLELLVALSIVLWVMKLVGGLAVAMVDLSDSKENATRKSLSP